jgi:hypothetical protein
MPTATLTEHRPAASVPRTGRCLQLRPLRAQLGLSPAMVGIGRTVIGSATDADVVVSLEGVAERHCEIHFDGREASLKVLSPLTWLNDGAVREAKLRAGDIVTLGPVELAVSFVDVPAPPPLPVDRPATVVEERAPSERPQPRRERSVATKAMPPRRDVDPPAQEPPVQPLLDSAEAGRRLRRDIERLEREVAWHRNHAVSAPTPAPATPPSDDSTNHLQKLLTRRELDLSAREQAFEQRRGELSLHLTDTQRQSAQLQQERDRLAQERNALAGHVAEFTRNREEFSEAERKLNEEEAALQVQRAELDREQRSLHTLSQSVAKARADLEVRQATLEQQHAEFDAAVAALDDDRALLQRERESAVAEARAAARDAEQLRSRVTAAMAQLEQREAAVRQQFQTIQTRGADLDAQQVALSDRERRSTSELSRRQQQVESQAQTLLARERQLAEREAALDVRLEECAEAAARVAREQDELELTRGRHARDRADLERLRGDLQSEQERLRSARQVVTEQSERLQSEADQLQVRHGELEQSTAALQQRLTEISRREGEHRVAQRELEARLQSLAARQKSLDEQGEELDARSVTLAARQTQVDAEAATAAESQRVEQQRLSAAQAALRSEQQRQADESARLINWEQDLRAQAELLAARDSASQQIQTLVSDSHTSTEPSIAEQQLAERERRLEQERQELLVLETSLIAREQELEATRTAAAATIDTDWEREKSDLESLHAAAAATAEAAAASLRAALDDVTAERDLLRDEMDQLYRARASEPSPAAAPLDVAAIQAVRDDLRAEAERLQMRWIEIEAAEQNVQAQREQLDALRDALAVERTAMERHALEADRTVAFELPPQAASDDNVPAQPQKFVAHYAEPTSEHTPTESANTEVASEMAAQDDWKPQAPPATQHSATSSDSTTGARESTGIRSQLAALFGINPSELDAAASRHGDEGASAEEQPAAHRELVPEPVMESVPVVQVAPSVPAAAVEVLPPADCEEDSIAAYMQRLLAQTQTSTRSEPVQRAPVIESRPEPRVTPAPEVIEPADVEPQPASRASRRMDEGEIAEQRAKIDSMRQIANLSARSAVARHYSRKLEVTYQIMLCLTVIGSVLATVLFCAGFWTSNSYQVQAMGAFVVTLITGMELARTTLRMRRVKKIVESAAPDEHGPAGGDPAPTTAEA